MWETTGQPDRNITHVEKGKNETESISPERQFFGHLVPNALVAVARISTIPSCHVITRLVRSQAEATRTFLPLTAYSRQKNIPTPHSPG